jgi:hypothetical protein
MTHFATPGADRVNRRYQNKIQKVTPSDPPRDPLQGALATFHGRHVCSLLYARSLDGTLVPLTVAHRAGLPLDRANPLLLTVYGAYGLPLSRPFDP